MIACLQPDSRTTHPPVRQAELKWDSMVYEHFEILRIHWLKNCQFEQGQLLQLFKIINKTNKITPRHVSCSTQFCKTQKQIGDDPTDEQTRRP